MPRPVLTCSSSGRGETAQRFLKGSGPTPPMLHSDNSCVKTIKPAVTRVHEMFAGLLWMFKW